MDISTLKQVFPEDQFIIKHDDRSKLNQTATIKTKGEPEKGCAAITIDEEGPEELYVANLDKCGISGSETLKKIEEFARMSGFKKITLSDMSTIFVCKQLIDLATLKILTKGESWYNSLGYKSINYDNEKKNNEALIKKTLKEIFNNPDLTSTEKDMKSSIISLLCHRTFKTPTSSAVISDNGTAVRAFTLREPEGVKRDDLTEEDLENHSLQSISNMILNLASDCKNEDAANVLRRLVICAKMGYLRNLRIHYDKNLEKTLDEPFSPPRSERGAYKTSNKTLSKGSKRGGSKRANRRKKSLKRKRL
jgi:hypothetical protein